MKSVLSTLCLTLVGFLLPLHAEQAPPKKVLGTLSVHSMTQGALFFMAGRVGEAIYQYQSPLQETCALVVPVVVGSRVNTSVGVAEVAGFSLQVYSEELHSSLISGQRIMRQDWHFSYDPLAINKDGVITEGIEREEVFILNSKRRWVSWITGYDEPENCLL